MLGSDIPAQLPCNRSGVTPPESFAPCITSTFKLCTSGTTQDLPHNYMQSTMHCGILSGDPVWAVLMSLLLLKVACRSTVTGGVQALLCLRLVQALRLAKEC